MPIIWVEFQSVKRKLYLKTNPIWVPIFFTSMKFERSISIKYIPLKVSYGRTIHKIQGNSIKCSVVITSKYYSQQGCVMLRYLDRVLLKIADLLINGL